VPPRPPGPWLAVPAGAALALAFAPASLAALAFLCPAILFLLWEGQAPRRAAWTGFLFTATLFLCGTYWIHHSVHLIGGAPLWIALLLMLGLVAIMGAYSAAAGYALARWGPPPGALRWLVALPAAWVLVEWFRGWFLSGFPWLALGYSQLGTPLAGYAPVAGVYGVSLAVALVAGALLALLHGSARVRLLAVGVIVAVWVAGALFDRREWTRPEGAEIPVALVQGAVPQRMKWEAGQRERTLELYRSLSEPYLGAAIVVWPEAALPALASDLTDFLAVLRDDAREAGSDLVMGLLRHEPDSDAYFNGLVAFAPDEQWYYKRRLVPFGEFFPVPAFVREWLRLMNLPYSDFEPGAADQPPLRAAGQTLAPTICYEDAYGAEQRALAGASTLLVNVSNDAWFGDSTAPHQHLDISRMRALESGRAMLRATNDGVTALIDADGSMRARLPQFEPGVLSGSVQPRTGLTPYLRAGNAPVIALSALGLLIAALRARTAPGPGRRERAGHRR